MACEVCEHCQSPVTGYEKVVIREGYSYHKKCHKCYVCSETNLADAEVFKGVIFCNSCAQRIFQGCSTARKLKNSHHGGRSRRSRSKSHRRRELRRHGDRRTDSSRDGVIELAGLAACITDSDDVVKQKHPSNTKISTQENALQVSQEEKVNELHNDQSQRRLANYAGDIIEHKSVRKHRCTLNSLTLIVRWDGNPTRPVKDQAQGQQLYMLSEARKIGMTTEVTEELLRQINWPVAGCKVKSYGHSDRPPRRHHRRKEPKERKPICSDLRIAELGISTEIANMALRKKSELPVIIRSDSRLTRPTHSLSILRQESDISGDGRDWPDSCTYFTSTMDETEKKKWMDRRIGSILKLPIKCFKKNILDRSSLISVIMNSNNDQHISVIRRFKDIFYDDVTKHQAKGLQKLYSTINRSKIPYKLGWVEMVANDSTVIKNESIISTNKRCSHYKTSHSYRCMRAQVMKLAGPTKSELALYRSKIKRVIAPPIFRKMFNSTCNCPTAGQRPLLTEKESINRHASSPRVGDFRRLSPDENLSRSGLLQNKVQSATIDESTKIQTR